MGETTQRPKTSPLFFFQVTRSAEVKKDNINGLSLFKHGHLPGVGWETGFRIWINANVFFVMIEDNDDSKARKIHHYVNYFNGLNRYSFSLRVQSMNPGFVNKRWRPFSDV